MVKISDRLTIHHKRGIKNSLGKPIRETKLFIDNKEPGVQGRYDIARIGRVTKVFQSVWRNISGKLKIVHSHWKR